jgi:hypothetical protein
LCYQNNLKKQSKTNNMNQTNTIAVAANFAASFQTSLVKTVLVIMCCLSSVGSFASGTDSAGKTTELSLLRAKGGVVHYTVTTGATSYSKDEVLSDDSYVFTGIESNIVIADPNGHFYIGVVTTGQLAKGNVYHQSSAGAASGYSLASFLAYGQGGQTMTAQPFDEGYAKIDRIGALDYKVSFQYSLKDKVSGKKVTITGSAILNDHQVAIR